MHANFAKQDSAKVTIEGRKGVNSGDVSLIKGHMLKYDYQLFDS